MRIPIGRSENMRRIRSKNTKPEVLLRKSLFAMGLRYRLHASELPGNPDIVFRSDRVAVFVHGCFWHQHEGCKQASTPKSNVSYWDSKLARNVTRDREHLSAISKAGYQAIVVWECEIEQNLDGATRAVVKAVRESRSVTT